MSLPSWPPSLPQNVQYTGYTERPPAVAVRTPMDAGPDNVRRSDVTGRRMFQLPLLLSAAQVETLDAFWRETLRHGSEAFEWLHPRTGDPATLRIAARPEMAEAGGLWRTTLQAEQEGVETDAQSPRVWPSSLPSGPIATAYGEALAEGGIRSDLPGPVHARQRSAAATPAIQCTLGLSAAQVQILDDFFRMHLAGGVLRFEWAHPRTGQPAWLRFLEPPEYTRPEGAWRATLHLEIMPAPPPVDDGSPVSVSALLSGETSEAYLCCVGIDHPTLTEPLLCVHAERPIEHQGATYNAYPFEVALPSDLERETAQVEISISNVDRRIVAALREVPPNNPPSVTLFVVRAAEPDIVERGPYVMMLREVEYDFLRVTGKCRWDDELDLEYPAIRVIASYFPGAF